MNQLSHELQLVATKLLTPQEIYQVNGGALGLIPESLRRKAYANLPPLVRQTLEAEARLREMLTRGATTYDELEKVAVRFGDAPRGEGSRDVPEGRWSYHSDGYFVRYLPSGYPTTRIIVYLPESFTVERDKLGRVARLSDAEGNRIEVKYDDTMEPLDVPSDPDLRGYAFKSVRFVRPFPAKPRHAQQAEWKDVGWTLVKASGAKSQPAGPAAALRKAPDRYGDGQRRFQDAREWEKEIGKLRTPASSGAGAESHFELALDLLNFEKGIEVVVAEGRGEKSEWSDRHLQRVFNAVQFELCQGAGGCASSAAPSGELRDEKDRAPVLFSSGSAPASGSGPPALLLAGPPAFAVNAWSSAPDFPDASGHATSPEQRLPEFDPSGQVAVPGNTARQRLSQSGRPKDPHCDQIPQLEEAIRQKKEIKDLYEKFQSQAKDCDDLARRVQDQLKRDCPDCKVQEGGHFDPSDKGKAQGECLDNCQFFPKPLCEWMNEACMQHEKQHSDDWQACVRFPSLCAKEQQDMTRYCAQQEKNGYDKEIEQLENTLRNLKQACAR